MKPDRPPHKDIWAREDWRLRLALLKESTAYRRFWDERGGHHIREAQAEIDQFYEAPPEGCTNIVAALFEHCEGASDATHAFFDGLYRFGIEIFDPYFDRALEALDPAKEDLPERLPLRFVDEPAAISMIEAPGLPIGEAPGPTLARLKPLKPSERLLKIDLSKKRGELLEDFKRLLDSVDFWRKAEERPATMTDNYAKWEPDNSRFRPEAWQALAVWRLRRQRKPYSEISKALGVKQSAAKMAFRRAFELIEGRPYDPEVFKRDSKTVRLPELKKTCATCPLRATCRELCPDVLAFVDQDQVKQRELTTPDL